MPTCAHYSRRWAGEPVFPAACGERTNEKGPRALPPGPFFYSGGSLRRSHFFSGAIEIRTVSPLLPGKPVNIASTRFGTM